MGKLIEVPFPINVNPVMELLYKPYKYYEVTDSEVKTLRNTFVTYQGLVLKNGLLVEGCAFNLRGREDNTFYYQFWRDTVEKMAVCKWGNSLPSIHLKGPQKYLLIHSKWFNYAFWINSFLPRLLTAEKSGLLKQAKLIVPSIWKELPYVWESLKAFDVEMEIISPDVHLFVDNLIMPTTRKWTSSFNPTEIRGISDRMLISLEDQGVVKKTEPSRVYLTRAKRGVRCVENEEEVLSVIKKYNFSVVVFENLNVWEQIELMARTTHFISIHGAGFTNMLFMKPNSSVLELINKPYAEKEYTFPFWKLANASALKYYAQLCNVDGDGALDFGGNGDLSETDYLVNKNLIVDIPLFEKNLALMMSENIN